MKLSAAERFAMLKEWVLPTASHPELRLHVDWTPHSNSENGDAGGELVSPRWS